MMQAKDKLRRVEQAIEALAPLELCCALCPKECRVDRRRGSDGFCRSGAQAAVSRALLHFGEEPVLSGYEDWKKQRSRGARGRAGSGAIFFSGCNLKCLFCQNYQISWLQEGHLVSDEELAGLMLGLERQGALNINLVSPTHLLLPILRALRLAIEKGLSLPIVYNTNGYEKASVVRHLEGIVDVYLPDLKYFSPGVSNRLSGAANYFKKAGPAIKEMSRQQPELVLDEDEIAQSGLIIRHLVLPHYLRESLDILDWIKANIAPGFCLSLMSQYHPCHRAPEEMRRRLAASEYREVAARAVELDFDHAFIQPEAFGPEEHFLPDFDQDDPFGWED